VKCEIDLARPEATKYTVQQRHLKNVDLEAMRQDVLNSSLLLTPAEDLLALTNQYNSVLREILDKHAPVKTREMTLRPHAPWYDKTLRTAKRKKRSLERKWMKSKLEIDKQIFHQSCSDYKKLLDNAKTSHHRSVISNCDQKQLFKVIDTLSVARVPVLLPTSGSNSELADGFVNFFDKKIQNIRDSLDRVPHAVTSVDVTDHCDSSFGQFQTISEDDVRGVVMKSSKKSSALDPLPMPFFLHVLDDLLPILTKIINGSLSSGCFPDTYKFARVKPLIKKPSLDCEDMRNYRPISNLRFDSKLVERVAVSQLHSYMKENGLQDNNQSAYREGSSTETALLRVSNDLLQTIDRGDEAVLVLLDFSAAFDTIDHQVLIARLENRFGITGKALQWFASYLENRCQAVAIESSLSNMVPLNYGVPQGSVAGPVIFTMYSLPIEDIAHANNISCMSYADDTQLHMSMKPDDRDASINKLEHCLKDIKAWTVQNKL
jgi:hypothetical protein